MRLAIVIPTLNEDSSLAETLQNALAIADEVVVSDGGSRDGTVALAEGLGARVVSGEPGRGGQLNRGAADTAAEALLFLHADTRLPEDAGQAIRKALSNGAAGGAFFLAFDTDRPMQRLGERLINLRTRLTRTPLGDQAQFVHRHTFEALGGFRDWPILEDLDFARRLKRHGRLALLPGPAVTAARRYTGGGTVRTVVRNWLIWILFFCGVSPHKLARLYRHIR
ncbi:MAG: TIGR04283 family arsenosugar biosynthesis glycosyltransferase [Acidobacteriota bacterium]